MIGRVNFILEESKCQQNIVNKLCDYRNDCHKRGIGCNKVAELLGIPYRKLLEKLGRPDKFTIGELERMAKVLKISPREMIFGDFNAKQD